MKTMLRCTVTGVFYVMALTAFAEGPIHINDGLCISGDCQNGQGTYQWTMIKKPVSSPARVQTGANQNTLRIEAQYQGQFADGKPDGKGKLTLHSLQEIYVGEFKQGLRHGNGRYTWPDGSYYDGTWKNDQKSGQGAEVFASGDRYVGGYLKNSFHGQGKYTFSSGESYLGEFVRGNLDGYGIFRWPNGDMFIGKYENNRRNGRGQLKKENGRSFPGIWIDDHYAGSEPLPDQKTSVLLRGGVGIKAGKLLNWIIRGR